jgi:large subunit ribosomal protein L9
MAQRLLLIQDVDNLGLKGEIVNVKPGYAYNFLIPQGYALVADRSALRHQTRLQEERRVQAEVERKQSEEAASSINGQTIEMEVRVDHEGHLYGSVSSLDIVHLLKEKTGVEINKRAVQLKAPIKQVGVFEVPLRLHEGIMATINVKVFPHAEQQ